MKRRFEIDRKYFKIAAYAFVVVALCIILEKFLGNAEAIGAITGAVFSSIKKIVSPFVYGFIIAYLANPLMLIFENRLFIRIPVFRKNLKGRRIVSIITTYVLVLGFIILVIAFFVPEFVNSLTGFMSDLPTNFENLKISISSFLAGTGLVSEAEMYEALSKASASLNDIITNLSSLIDPILTQTINVAAYTYNVIMGLFISFYMLANKESFLKKIKKVMYAFLDESLVNKLIRAGDRVNDMFQRFILGKTIDSAIIGVLFYAGASIINAPFVFLLSVIVGVTNMIPYFGPFIGAIPTILIVLLTAPSKAFFISVFILALQQFDGIVLGPKILGTAIGINPIWIIFSITIGGAVAGPLGMFLGVPLFASLKMFFDEFVDKKYTEKYFYENSGNDIDKYELYAPPDKDRDD